MIRHIAICDENIEDLKLSKSVIERFLKQVEWKSEVTAYGNPQELLDDLKQRTDEEQLIFTEIDLINMNGISLCESINEKYPNIHVAYLTNQLSYATDVYRTKHLHFTLKNELEKRMHEIHQALVQAESSKENNYLSIYMQGKVTRIATNQIRYIESHNHVLYIHAECDTYRVYDKLSSILKRLPAQFVQCHKSFLINVDYINTIDGKEVVLNDGKRINISRTYGRNLKKLFSV